MVVNIVDISETFSGVVSSVRSLPRWFPLFSFFCLLVSSGSDFHPDTRGVVIDIFKFILGSLVQLCCVEGGMLQRNNTGICSQCLSHAGHAPAHSAHHSGSTLLRREPSEAGPRLHAPLQSTSLRHGAQVALRGTGSVGPAFCALPRTEWLRCLASAVAATHRLSRPCCSIFWVYHWLSFSGRW